MAFAVEILVAMIAVIDLITGVIDIVVLHIHVPGWRLSISGVTSLVHAADAS
jgi:hypothetical protein